MGIAPIDPFEEPPTEAEAMFFGPPIVSILGAGFVGVIAAQFVSVSPAIAIAAIGLPPLWLAARFVIRYFIEFDETRSVRD